MKLHKKKRDKTREKPRSVKLNDEFIRDAAWQISQQVKAGFITPEQATEMYKRVIKKVNKHQGFTSKYTGKGKLRGQVAEQREAIDNQPESVS